MGSAVGRSPTSEAPAGTRRSRGTRRNRAARQPLAEPRGVEGAPARRVGLDLRSGHRERPGADPGHREGRFVANRVTRSHPAMLDCRGTASQLSNQSATEGRAMKTKNPAMICPHCQTKGQVSTEPKKLKQGLSGGKVVAGLLTLGLTAITPGIGLSRKQTYTQASCGNCRAEWLF